MSRNTHTLTDIQCSEHSNHSHCSPANSVGGHHPVAVVSGRSQSSQLNRELQVGSSKVVATL